MPQTTAAKKALRQSAKRRVRNDRWRAAIRDAKNKLRDAVTNQDTAATEQAHQQLQKILDRAARRNIIHANKAARLKSRLSKHRA